MALFTAIDRARTYMEVVDQIRDGVRNGLISPGEKLPGERALATELGIGRQCLREALSVLAVLGIAEVRKGRGTYITQDAPQRLDATQVLPAELGDPFEFMEARKILEPQVAALAAKRRRSSAVDKLNLLVRDMQDCLSKGRTFTEEAKQFHLVIADACGNAALTAIVHQLIESTGKQLWIQFKERSHQTAGSSDLSLAEHTAIADAIVKKNASGAARAMTKHLERIIKNFLK